MAGVQKIVAPARRARFSSSVIRPSHSTRGVRRAMSASVSGPSDATHSTASRSRPTQASSSTPRPLRGSWRPQNSTAGRSDGVGSTFTYASTSTPLGSSRYEPPSASSAIVARVRADRHPHREPLRGARARSCAATCTRPSRSPTRHGTCPTFGTSLPSSAALVGPGTSGSCRCSTSGSNTRSASSVRSDAVVWSCDHRHHAAVGRDADARRRRW